MWKNWSPEAVPGSFGNVSLSDLFRDNLQVLNRQFVFRIELQNAFVCGFRGFKVVALEKADSQSKKRFNVASILLDNGDVVCACILEVGIPQFIVAACFQRWCVFRIMGQRLIEKRFESVDVSSLIFSKS